MVCAGLLLISRPTVAVDVYPYEPPVVSLPISVIATQELLNAIVIAPGGQSHTNGFAADNCLATYLDPTGSTNGLCVIFDDAGPQADIFTNAGQYRIVVASVTNTFDVLEVGAAEQSLFPALRSNILAQVLFISAPTALTDEMKAKAQQILSVVTNGPYADYAQTYLALDAFYAPSLNPAEILAQGGRDFSPVVAQFESFGVSNRLLRAVYFYHEGLAQLHAQRRTDAITTWCTLLKEFPQGLSSEAVSRQIRQIFKGAIAWYRLNEGVGTITANMVCSGPSGQLTGGFLPTWVSGIDSNALQFDGASAYVEVPTNAVLDAATNALTISLWVKSTNNTDRAVISYRAHEYDSGWRLFYQTGKVLFQWTSPSGSWHTLEATGSFPSNQWAHLAAVFQPTNAYLYLNGACLTTNTSAGSSLWLNSTNNLKIGRCDSGSEYWFPGKIDDVRVYGRALSTDEIADIYGMDTDAEGLSNVQEVNIYGTNPSDPDTDHDGVSDYDELQRGTDPNNPQSAGISLYANSLIGSNLFDGLTPTVADGHGPKRNIQSALDIALDGDTVEIAGEQTPYGEGAWSPGPVIITLRPTGTVTIQP